MPRSRQQEVLIMRPIMNYIAESSVIAGLAQKILQPKHNNYSEQPLYSTLAHMPEYELVDSVVYNKYKERLKCTTQGMRGLSAWAAFLLAYLSTMGQGVSLCCFDFSGEGKSEGTVVTYGQKEKDDIRAVLGYLRTCGYEKFVLWGRSMGATCTLMFSIKEKPKDVVLQILDSPFISFQEAALELTKKRMQVPELILKLALQAVKVNLASKQYNPFSICFDKPIFCEIPTIFVYSQTDEVISPQNSRRLISNFRGRFEKLVINQTHNSIRKNETVKQLIEAVKKYLNTKKQPSVEYAEIETKYQTPKHNNKPQNQIRNSFDHYGIWVSSKHTDDPTFKDKFSPSMPKTREESTKSRPRSSIKVYSRQVSGQLAWEKQQREIVLAFNPDGKCRVSPGRR